MRDPWEVSAGHAWILAADARLYPHFTIESLMITRMVLIGSTGVFSFFVRPVTFSPGAVTERRNFTCGLHAAMLVDSLALVKRGSYLDYWGNERRKLRKQRYLYGEHDRRRVRSSKPCQEQVRPSIRLKPSVVIPRPTEGFNEVFFRAWMVSCGACTGDLC